MMLSSLCMKAVFHFSGLLAVLCFLSSSASAQTCVQPPASLVSWWPGDGNAQDIADENHGTLHDDTMFAPGMVSQAFSFDGDGDYVAVPGSASFNALTSVITVDAWIKVSSFPDTHSTIISKGDTSWRLQRVGDSNTIRFGTNHPEFHDLDGTIPVDDGQWHHVAGVFDGTTKYLYIDGVLDVSATMDLPLATNNFEVRIGDNAEEQGRYWHGQIDEVEG